MATIFDVLLNQHFNNSSFNNKSQPTKQEIINIVPELDLVETKDSLIIETELAGVNKEDIQIEIKDSKLYIQGEKKRSTYKDNTITSDKSTNTENEPLIEGFEDETTTTSTNTDSSLESPRKKARSEPTSDSSKDKVRKYITERSYGKFKRYLDLNRLLHTLDLSSIKTQFNNGLLTITINKKKDYSSTIKINLN
ncbi:hypothetical protein DICPUDRAFT_91426 [Dictyostelium purpureum]|uniref:SHSP domain-containing protein n=1 Tax=Dictyostelium purpureum TaxID=5786 RepID=F0ZC58_DICPU|nr:uncharacterized protein DICPUDRAFT_91426 [Dictyostelium purpureum]EGC38438.1 hypothetical protein DICPUDRAFT_91426 [Dictyostelium purpureum]|eukprot:XP_003284996.1 hypothetical protein DICPUDRAFT_91426 [Dictyostelium purpureum]